jgi:hypothetical protein
MILDVLFIFCRPVAGKPSPILTVDVYHWTASIVACIERGAFKKPEY